MILAGLQAEPSRFRDTVGLWFVDNQAKLVAPVLGRSGHPDLDELALVIHVALYALRWLLRMGLEPTELGRRHLVRWTA